MGLIVGIVSGVAVATAVYRRITNRAASATHELLSAANLPKWRLTRGYEKRPAWVASHSESIGDLSRITYFPGCHGQSSKASLPIFTPFGIVTLVRALHL